MKIQIPTPCSEDWNKMTPTEKGAFCDKCAFEVIDFTNQSPEEIKETLKARSGQRTCGHIAPVQMDMVNSNYHVWENQPVSIFKSKFLYACLIVFGMTLFTGCQDNGPVHDVGEIETIDTGMVEEDTTSSCGGDDIIDGMIEPVEGEIIMEDDHNDEGHNLDGQVKGMIEEVDE
ncbi:hypothetical protein K6119_17580 [Paracrocinitomix mangrovi]|uniref:hypothetical protein n=1 Tax=Paracrocinitomix mangrovi TaxID=2862509 RepID=UPI001C8D5CD6|nr:hypothetical protein [Paracrocinitomix mangrovi]UKN01537.1 hypothetical protein K6119_17580 [Paracrocinitomix mangrovi]